jgi:hypothetical protein
MKATIIVAVILLAGALVWHKLFSPTARIEAAYRACMKEVGAAADAAKIGAPADDAPARVQSPVAAATRGIDEIVQGAIHGFGGAACEQVRLRCRDDYGGERCQAALRQYR